MSRLILVVNEGSSSLKVQLFALDGSGLDMRLHGHISGIGTRPHFAARTAQGSQIADQTLDPAAHRDHAACFSFLAEWLSEQFSIGDLAGVGHRVVHGGTKFSAPTRLDADVLAVLEACIPLAPLHQPFNLAPIRVLLERRPDLPQVACFDTAFHRTQPVVAELFGLPKRYYDEGVRRYGFHGLSYEYIARHLPKIAPEMADRRVVVAHLGSGASMCAMRAGKSVANSLGFTALDGLPMGTRCGALDPGVVFYLARERGMSTGDIEFMLYHQSGLLGLSGVSNDMRLLLESDAPDAKLAIDYFVYRVGRELGSLTAALGGLDALVFTAGIGENSPEIRARVCRQAEWLGIELDAEANRAGGPRITRPGSRVSAWTIPTNEELMIAGHTVRVLGLT
jgi:acetate kinase